MKIQRREFLRSVAGVSGLAAFAGWDVLRGVEGSSLQAQPVALPDPALSGIEHVVVVMIENRSFDHMLGWLPGSDGRQRGLKYTDTAGVVHRTYPLAPDYTGCGHPDPDHSWEGGRIQYDAGAMDGFLQSGNDEYAIGFYTKHDRPFFNTLATEYTTLDRSFCSILGPTFPNRLFLHAAQTDRLSNTSALAAMPTIWDSLAAAGVSHRYYYSNLPFLGLWGLKYLPISGTYPEFLFEAALGILPAVSFVDPRFTLGENDPTGNDDHPHADIRAADAFLSELVRAVVNGPLRDRTVVIITYDEWGGFFDHVAPPRAAAPNGVDPDLDAGGKALLGFRVPTLVVSPWTRSGAAPRVQHGVGDHTSILKLIEWRWGLAPLTARDASSDVQNLADVLNFAAPDFTVPALPSPLAPVPQLCPPATAASSLAESEWARLLNSGLLAGWPSAGIGNRE